MSLRRRITVCIGLILLFLFANSGVYFWGSSERSEGLMALQKAITGQLRAHEVKQLLENNNKKIQVLMTLKESTDERLDGQELKLALEGIKEIDLKIISLDRFLSGHTEDVYLSLKQSYARLRNTWLLFLDDYNKSTATHSNKQLLVAYQLVHNGLTQFQSKESQNAEEQAQQINDIITLTTRAYSFVFLFSICLTSVLGFLLVRYTNKSLHHLQLGVEHISAGDYSYRIPPFSKDELGSLATAFNNMSHKLGHAITDAELQRRNAERERENADQANRAKSVFLANMSHELRNPLNLIIGYSEMVSEQIKEDETVPIDTFAEDIDTITAQGKHLTDLIKDILDVSKIEAGKAQLHNEWFNPNITLIELADIFSPLAAEKGITVSTELDADLPKLYTDLTKFRQIMNNLLSNARKFTKQGSIIIRSTQQMSGGIDCMQFEIEDTGIGMSPSQSSQIFDSFVQADSSTTKEYGGTGLGLAISREYCELMGGELFVSSAKGQGTTFYLQLPLTDIPENAVVTPSFSDLSESDASIPILTKGTMKRSTDTEPA